MRKIIKEKREQNFLCLIKVLNEHMNEITIDVIYHVRISFSVAPLCVCVRASHF